MTDKYIYGKKASDVSCADGVSGVLIKSFGGGFVFRRYFDDSTFIDYQVNHDDLSVTIDSDALAAFYSSGEYHSLDHSPEVFGLKRVEE